MVGALSCLANEMGVGVAAQNEAAGLDHVTGDICGCCLLV